MARRAVTVPIIIIFIMALASAVCAAVDYHSRPGTVRHTLSLPDGVSVVLDSMHVKSAIGPYVFIKDPWCANDLLPVYTNARVDIGWSIEVTGTTATIQGRRILIATRIRVYMCRNGRPFVFMPKSMYEPFEWPYMEDLPLGMGTMDVPPPPDPGTGSGTPAPASIPPAGSISEVKTKSGAVELTGKIVTDVFHTPGTQDVAYFYIEEADRSCGIKVVPSYPIPVESGNIVFVKGHAQGDASGAEYCIASAIVTCTGSTVSPKPLGLAQRSIAASTYGNQPALYLKSTESQGSPAISGNGQNIVGRRVRVWGKVTDVDGNACWIDDGSGLISTSSGAVRTGVKVIFEGGHSYTQNSRIDGITGILGAEMSEDATPRPIPIIRVPRGAPAGSKIIRVRPAPEGSDSHLGINWTTDAMATIQGAINRAAAGDEVWVATGTYQEAIQMASGVSVYGGFDTADTSREERDWTANSTIIDTSNMITSVVSAINLSAFARIDGFAITGGFAEVGGGGVYCEFSPLVIANNTLYLNTTDRWGNGAAIYCSGSSPVIFGNNLYSNNALTSDGAVVYVQGGTPLIAGNTIIWDGYSGTGICCSASNATLVGNDVSDFGTGVNVLPGSNVSASFNSVHSCAQGIRCDNSSISVFDNNISSCVGRGIYLNTSTASVSGNVVRSCGSGIYFESGTGSIRNNFVTAQGATGSGIYVLGSVSTITVANNTVTHTPNAVTIEGNLSAIQLANNILAYNTNGVTKASTGNTGSPTIHYNNIYSNGDDYAGGIADLKGQDGNISVDPEFLDDDLHINRNSPCAGGGYNGAVPEDDSDIDGEARIKPSNGRVDIGADESTNCGWHIKTESTTMGLIGQQIQVVVTVTDDNGNPVIGQYVNFSVVEGNGSLSTTSVLTSSDGKSQTYITADSAGLITLKSSVIDPCGQPLEDTAPVYFYNPDNATTEYDWPMFHHDIALLGVTPAVIGSSIQDPDPAKRLPKKWVKTLNGNSGNSSEVTWPSPVVANGIVYVATNAGWLYAFDAATGTQLASLDVGAPIHGTPCVYNGLIFVGAEYGDVPQSSGRLHVYTLQSGNFVELWHYDCPSGQLIWGSPTVYDGAVYFGSTFNTTNFNDGWLHAVDLAFQRDRSGSPAYMRYTAVGNTPGIDANYRRAGGASEPRAYLSDYSCYVTAIGCQDGGKVWEWAGDTFSMYGSVTAYGGWIFIGTNALREYKLKDDGDTAPGTPPSSDAWLISNGLGAVKSTQACWNDRVFFGSDNNNIYCVGATNFVLPEYSKKDLGSAVISSPAISSANGLVFAASLNGKVWALDASNLANERWSYDIPLEENKAGLTIRSSPAIVNGRMFIVAGDSNSRYLYCFGD